MTIEIKILNAERGEIRIDGEIGGGWFEESPVTAKQFAKDLKALGKPKALDIYINSPGGSVFDGQAIYNQIKRHAAKKTAYIEGLAASIASVIAMAADEIVIPENALMMVHRASGVVAGDAGDMRRTAETLERVESGMIAAYVAKTGRDADDIQELMNAETWMTGAEAVALGFADRVGDPIEATACITPDALAHFKAPPMAITTLAPQPIPADSVPKEEPMNEPVTEATETPAVADPVVEPVVAPESPVVSDTPSAPVVVAAPVADAEHAAFIAAQCHQSGCSVLAAGLIAAQATKAQVEARMAEAAQIKAACVLAKLPAQTDHYLASGMGLTAVRADLFLQLAARDQQAPVNTALSTEATQAAASLPLEDRCKAEWQASPSLRAEFADSLDSFIAYSRAASNGQVRVFTK